jgi:ATP adenylyltransferase
METLFTPWRYRYIKEPHSERADHDECFFCRASREPDDPERLVVHRAEHHVVLLNRYPYTNGHLLIAPATHQPVAHYRGEAGAELWRLVGRSQEVLHRAYHPDGFNLGANVGRAAGAGVPGHFHFHVVCRWEADTNFMSAVGDTRLVPQELEDTRALLRGLFDETRPS